MEQKTLFGHIAGIVLFALLPVIAFAQNDSVYVQVKNDTVTIWNTEAAPENCLARYKFTVTTSNDTVSVVETDTAGVIGTCTDCLFNLSASAVGLPQGNYRAMVYRRYLKEYMYPLDTTIFVDSASFTAPSPNAGTLSWSSYQSQCIKDAIQEHDHQPVGYSLEINYPNPFNPQTIISYSVPVQGKVTLKIYDVLGREIRTLFNGPRAAGNYSVMFDASGLSSGVYFYRLSAGEFSVTKKMMFLK